MMKALLALLAALALGACASPVVAHAAMESTEGTIVGDVRFDGDVVVAMGQAVLTIELHQKGSDVQLYPPVTVPAGKVWCGRISTEESLELDAGEPLPYWAAALFTQAEIVELGLEFGDG